MKCPTCGSWVWLEEDGIYELAQNVPVFTMCKHCNHPMKLEVKMIAVKFSLSDCKDTMTEVK